MRLYIFYTFLFCGSLFYTGCSSIPSGNLFREDRYKDMRAYEKDVGSRIEQYLEVARQELIENFERKEYLMIREDQPPPVIHPRKDTTLRELIFSAHKNQKISDEQRLEYIENCDDLYALWEKHWRIARKKANRMGFPR
jgi:hypothetical protein